MKLTSKGIIGIIFDKEVRMTDCLRRYRR